MSVRKELELLARFCKGEGLNIGCGHIKIADSIGVDISYQAKAAQIVCEAADLPYHNEALDYIISANCLEHINTGPLVVLREWLRVLKVGGKIAIVVPDAEYGIWSMTGDRGRCGELCKPEREMEHVHAFTDNALRMLFEFAGMDNIHTDKIDRRPERNEMTLFAYGTKSEAYKCQRY